MGASSVTFISTLLANLYGGVDPSVAWSVQDNTDQVVLEQLVNAEIDIAFIEPNNVEAGLMQSVLVDVNFLLLPTYLIAPALAYNPQITASVSIAAYNLTVSIGTLGLILYSCITAWNDPRLIAENPYLGSLLPAASTQLVPLTLVSGCGFTAEDAPVTFQMRAAVLQYLAATVDLQLGYCIGNYTSAQAQAFESCADTPALDLLYLADETAVPSLILGVTGGAGAMDASSSASYGFAIVTDTRDGAWTNTQANKLGMAACASDTFNAALLADGLALGLSADSQNPHCYRATQQVMAVIRTQYSSSATDASGCDRGYNALQFLQWFYTTPIIDVLVESGNQLRVSSLDPAILSAFLVRLNTVMCDGDTLLLTLPVEWTLSGGVASFVYALCSVGLICCLVLSGIVAHHRRHPIIRSASPIFLLLSLLGVAFLFGSGFLLVAPVTSFSCSAFSWLLNIGLMLTFSPLFAKTWRIYRIFGRKKLSVILISNTKLLLLCGGILSMELLLMAAWQGVGNLQPITNDVTTSDRVSLTVSLSSARFVVDEYVQCGVAEGDNRSMFLVIIVEKCMLFAVGALLAFTTRKVSSTFNESSGVALAIYNVCFTIGIIAPIILVISAVGDVLTLLLAFALLWIAYFTCGILFVPKVMQILFHTDASGQQLNSSIQASSQSSSGYMFMSIAALSTVAVLQGYHAALRKHLAQVEAKLGKLKGNSVLREAGERKPSPQSNGRGVAAKGDSQNSLSSSVRDERSVVRAVAATRAAPAGKAGAAMTAQHSLSEKSDGASPLHAVTEAPLAQLPLGRQGSAFTAGHRSSASVSAAD